MIAIDPWTGRERGRLAESSPPEVAAAIGRLGPAVLAPAELAAIHAGLRELAAILVRERTTIVEALVHEAGKTLADASAEADLLPRKIAITLDAGLQRTPQALPSGPGSVWRPRGLAAVLGPSNFPLHLLHGLIVPALAVGCPVIAKPSERCPLIGRRYADWLEAAGLGGRVQVVHGATAVVAAMLDHLQLATVAAVGGRAMGLALARRLAERPEVVLALELGGVNPAVVLEDADIASAAPLVAEGAWRMCGQRCTATRQVHVPRSRLGAWVQALQAHREAWRSDGSPAGAAGPMVDARSARAFANAITSLPPGLALVAGDPAWPGPGRTPPPPEQSPWLDPLLLQVEDAAVRQHRLLVQEQFGPGLVIDAYDDLEELIARLGRLPGRLAAAVFTASPERFRWCCERLPFGLVTHNRPTAGARSDLPFGGLGTSGNGRPAAVAAGAIFADECAVWP